MLAISRSHRCAIYSLYIATEQGVLQVSAEEPLLNRRLPLSKGLKCPFEESYNNFSLILQPPQPPALGSFFSAIKRLAQQERCGNHPSPLCAAKPCNMLQLNLVTPKNAPLLHNTRTAMVFSVA